MRSKALEGKIRAARLTCSGKENAVSPVFYLVSAMTVAGALAAVLLKLWSTVRWR